VAAVIEHEPCFGHAVLVRQTDQNLREGTSTLERAAWLAKSPAVALATLLLLSGTYFGSRREFGAFLISVPFLTLLFVGALTAATLTTRRKGERGRASVAWTLICLTPLAYLCSYGPAQRIRFLLWAPAHYRQLARASEKNGIVIGWDSWGMAGQDTFSYLVVDTEDRLGSKARAVQWTKQIGQSCGFWEVQKMWPRLYVVTTYTNCPYDGVEPAN
jgi:hypothetical protein